MQWALSSRQLAGVTVELSATEAETATHSEDDGELLDAGDGTWTCLVCNRNGYPVPA